MRRLNAAAAVSALAAALLVCAPLGAAGVQGLYDKYEALNTDVNLKTRWVGGRPPAFVQMQIRYIQQIATARDAEGVPVLLKITDEYLARINALPKAKILTSPLQAIQLPLIRGLASHVDNEKVRTALQTLVDNDRLKEYAHAAALGALARWRVAQIKPEDDPTGSKRGSILLDDILQKLDFAALLHAPNRMTEIVKGASTLAVGDPMKVRQALATAGTLGAQYAADFAFISVLLGRVNGGVEASAAEKRLAGDLGAKYVGTFLPLVRKEKYPSDVLGRALAQLAGRKGFEPLARTLRAAGLKPVEPPKTPAAQPPRRLPPGTRIRK